MTVSSTNGAEKTAKNETGPLSYTIHKINSKWMKDLNVRQDYIKILEENTGRNLFYLSCSNFLLDRSSKARETKEKMNYWNFIKIKSFCTAKKTINKTKRQSPEWERYLQMTYQKKGLYPNSMRTSQTQHSKNK